MKLQENSGVTLYHQLKQILKNKILKKEWQPGDKIPKELDLIDEYGVSRVTVRQAVLELVREGLLTRKKGKGTYVASANYQTSFAVKFTYPEEFGKRHELIAKERLVPTEFVKEQLHLEAQEEIYKITRLRYFNEEKVAVEIMYVPVKLFPNMGELISHRPLYDLLQETYHIRLEHFSTRIEPKIMTCEEKRLLGLKGQQAGLLLHRTCYDDYGKALIYHSSLFRADCCTFLFS